MEKKATARPLGARQKTWKQQHRPLPAVKKEVWNTPTQETKSFQPDTQNRYERDTDRDRDKQFGHGNRSHNGQASCEQKTHNKGNVLSQTKRTEAATQTTCEKETMGKQSKHQKMTKKRLWKQKHLTTQRKPETNRKEKEWANKSQLHRYGLMRKQTRRKLTNRQAVTKNMQTKQRATQTIMERGNEQTKVLETVTIMQSISTTRLAFHNWRTNKAA